MNEQNNQNNPLSNISPHKRKLLEILLKQEGLDLPDNQTSLIKRNNLDNLPLSFNQQQIWFMHELDSTKSAYNECFSIQFKKKLNIDVMETSINTLVQRHESLRTVFPVTDDGKQFQEILSEIKITLNRINLLFLSQKDKDVEIDKLFKEEAQKPFELDKGPLIRTNLIMVDPNENILLITIHHIICDAWSNEIFFEELNLIYESLLNNNVLPFNELRWQYGDFTLWQRERLEGENLELLLNYWKAKLSDAPPSIEMPSYLKRPNAPTFKGASHSFVVPKSVSKSIKELSALQGVTNFTTLFSAFTLLLFKYSRQEDIIVGIPVANRNKYEFAKVIGLFSNNLPFRANLSGNPTYNQLIHRVHEAITEMLQFQEIPLDILVKELKIKRDLTKNPLFQIEFVYENKSDVGLAFKNSNIIVTKINNETSKFDLTLYIEENGDVFNGRIEFNNNLFNEVIISNMAQHFLDILSQVSRNCNKHLNDFSLISQDEEGSSILSKSEATDSPVASSIHQLFEQIAKVHANSIAVSCEDNHMTYLELNRHANQLANYLKTNCTKTNKLIGICMERSSDMVVGILAILKAGCAYVPLDPSYPNERIKYIVEDSGIDVAIVHECFKDKFSETSCSAVAVDSDWHLISTESTENINVNVHPNDLAYVIYTSGSTGKPKGVLVEHRNVINLLSSTNKLFNFDSTDVWTLFHSYAFDFSVWELWGALTNGCKLIIVPYWMSRSPYDFYELLKKEKVTVLSQTPLAFRQIIKVDEETSKQSSGLTLRYVVFGGDALDVKGLAPWITKYGDKYPQLINMYGITETTVHVTYRRIKKNDLVNTVGSVIGNQLHGLTLHILDQGLNPMPIGVSGEIFVGGKGVSRGYLNRPDLTSERYIPDPFSNEPGARLYKSGDLAKLLPNGDIEYQGRIDNQVKLRGFRIELGEIESVLLDHPLISECTVQLKENDKKQKDLIAYIITKSENENIDQSSLKEFLTKNLPSYMIPSYFIKLQRIPLTSNGKIDRASLPNPTLPTRLISKPRNKIELELAQIWEHVLGSEVGIHDNYFDLGGDSIRSIQIIALARKKGLNVTVEQLFKYQTINELVQVISTKSENQMTELQIKKFSMISANDIKKLPKGLDDAYPMSMLQLGLLFHSQIDCRLYQDIISYQLESIFNADAFRESISELVSKHAVLRTSFNISSYSEPLQIVQKQVPLPVEIIDIRNYSEQGIILNQFQEELKKHKFDWQMAPMYKFVIHRLTDKTFQLTFSFHHAILDGWSVASLVTEFLNNYVNVIKKKPYKNRTSKESISFKNYIFMEKEAINSSEFNNFWTQKLLNFSPTVLPSCLRNRDNRIQKGVKKVKLSGEISREIQRIARLAGTPVKSVLLAIHLRSLKILTGQEDLTTGLVMNCRIEQNDGEKVLGLFLNTLPFRMNLPDGTWLDLIKQTFIAELEMERYKRYPLAKIQRDCGENSLFETSFNFTQFHVYNNLNDDIKILGTNFYQANNFTLTAQFSQALNSQQLSLDLEYNINVISEEQIESISKCYINITKNLIAETVNNYKIQDRLKILSNVREDELENVVNANKCIHHLFENQAQQSPENIAVSIEGETISYQELNQRANQLGRFLQSQGVGPEVVVCIYTGKSIETVIAILAVLKAGGTFLCLDSNLPDSRKKYMLKDSRASIVLVNNNLPTKFTDNQIRIISLNECQSLLSQIDSNNLTSQTQLQNSAYVVYTSGSTGVPKGVVVEHKQISNYLLGIQAIVKFKHRSSFAILSSFSADLGYTMLFSSMLMGGILHILTDEIISESYLFSDYIQQNKIDYLKITPSLLNALQSSKEIKAVMPRHGLIVGGEASRWKWFRKLQEIEPECSIYNHYGPTEATIGVLVFKLEEQSLDLEYNTTPLGFPIINTSTYVLNSRLEPVKEGQTGTLYIGGYNVSRGYLNKPDLTAKNFLPNPFSRIPGERLYATGDIVRLLADGNLEFLGRIDDQIKIRGYRVELGDINTAICSHKQIKDSFVIVREKDNIKQLVAFVVLNPKSVIKRDELASFLEEQLPLFMVPSQFIFLESIPKGPNGKIDRQALVRIMETSSITKCQETKTRIEEIVTNIWQETLSREGILLNSDFFAVGGDSLSAMRVVARIKETFNVDISIKEFFLASTVKRLSQKIQSTKKIVQHDGATLTKRNPMEGAPPLSFAQQRLLFLHLLEPKSSQYNVPFIYRLKGELDRKALEDSLNGIIQRHEVLRTRYLILNGEPAQAIEKYSKLKIKEVDLAPLYLDTEDMTVQEIIQKEINAPFNLQVAPCLKASLFRIDTDEFILIMNIHHIVSDAQSNRILVNELNLFYNAITNGQPINIPDLPIQYGDFAFWQRQSFNEINIMEKQINFWKNKLKDLTPSLDLPIDTPYPAVQKYIGSTENIVVPRRISKSLISLSRNSEVTLFMTLLTAFKVLLFRYSGNPDIAVGSPISLRDREELDQQIGNFINTIVLRTDLSGNPTFLELLSKVKEVVLEAEEHKELPFEKLVEIINPERLFTYNPIHQVVFSLDSSEKVNLDLSSIVATPLSIERGTSKVDLTMMVSVLSNKMIVEIEYDSYLFKRKTIKRMLNNFITLLNSIITNPSGNIDNLSLLSVPERNQVLNVWSRSDESYPTETFIHQLFVEQAAKIPKDIALVSGNTKMTYGELNDKSNQLAHYLNKLGVGPEQIVAVYLDRSPEMVIAILGILKAGGAYLPLDPSYPLERIKYMLNDTKATILVTKSNLSQDKNIGNVTFVNMDKEIENIQKESNSNCIYPINQKNLAYAIYTSGSTGKPKGVLVEHKGLTNMVWTDFKHYGVTRGSRVLHITSFGFDASLYGMLIALLRGATLYIADFEQFSGSESISEQLCNWGITFAHLSPSMLRVLSPSKVPCLETIVTFGESLTNELVEKWSHSRKFFNGYGPTETTIGAARMLCNRKNKYSYPPIGRPWSNYEIYILDKHLLPVPVGAVGEVYISGVGVARGYLNQEDLTAENFIPNLYDTKYGGSRLYKTGDLARYLSDGNIQFVGRVDTQIKLRGFRIELAEIESILLSHKLVFECLVTVLKNNKGDRRMVAYVVLDTDRSNENNYLDELNEYMHKRLPSYMLPSTIEVLEKIPLTVNGKVDTSKLPKPKANNVKKKKAELPGNQLEKALANIFEEILDVSPIGIKDNFFVLGGHSLLVVKLISRIHESIGIKLPISCVFQQGTVEGIADMILKSSNLNEKWRTKK